MLDVGIGKKIRKRLEIQQDAGNSEIVEGNGVGQDQPIATKAENPTEASPL